MSGGGGCSICRLRGVTRLAEARGQSVAWVGHSRQGWEQLLHQGRWMRGSSAADTGRRAQNVAGFSCQEACVHALPHAHLVCLALIPPLAGNHDHKRGAAQYDGPAHGCRSGGNEAIGHHNID